MPASFWSGRPVLVTGATGFVGGWLTPALMERGAAVIVLAGRSGGANAPSWWNRVAVEEGTVTDLERLRAICRRHRVATVFHLAAQALVETALADPAGTLDTNVRGTWTVLEAARQAEVGQVIVASSKHAYRQSSGASREEDALGGIYPYDVSKSCADLIAGMYGKMYPLRTAVARCGNLYGGGDLNFSRVIPGVIRAACAGEQFVLRGDGRSKRDYLYVEDAVEAYLMLAERLAADASLGGEAFNFSLGRALSTIDVVETVLRTMGCSGAPSMAQAPARGEAQEHYLDISKAAARLDWRPKFDFEQGLQPTIGWYREFLGSAGAASGEPARTLTESRK
jgi:CDP-glucose 4,6-dehydratase